MTRALERHDAQQAQVVPVIVRHCDWSTARFAKLQALPDRARPVEAWTSSDAAWTNVAKGTYQLLPSARSCRTRAPGCGARRRVAAGCSPRQWHAGEPNGRSSTTVAEHAGTRRSAAPRLRWIGRGSRAVRSSRTSSMSGSNTARSKGLLLTFWTIPIHRNLCSLVLPAGFRKHNGERMVGAGELGGPLRPGRRRGLPARRVNPRSAAARETSTPGLSPAGGRRSTRRGPVATWNRLSEAYRSG
jgi:hypothetical protein